VRYNVPFSSIIEDPAAHIVPLAIRFSHCDAIFTVFSFRVFPVVRLMSIPVQVDGSCSICPLIFTFCNPVIESDHDGLSIISIPWDHRIDKCILFRIVDASQLAAHFLALTQKIRVLVVFSFAVRQIAVATVALDLPRGCGANRRRSICCLKTHVRDGRCHYHELEQLHVFGFGC